MTDIVLIERVASKIYTIRDTKFNAPSVRALKIFDITQVTTAEALQFRHAVLGPG